MRNILVAVDKTKGSKTAIEKFCNIMSWCSPETVILLYVQKYDASFLMDETLGISELSAMREALHGSEYQKKLDEQAEEVLSYYKKTLENKGIGEIRTITKTGHPADEILATAKEEDVDMIVLGSRGRRFDPIMMGSVSREVANKSDRPVLISK